MFTTTTLVMPVEKREEALRRPPLRLPVIAPKEDQSSSASSSRSGPSVPPRSRLPPRSRSGCWTCRHRKVKCDETRPLCGPCSRLNLSCDFNPRVAFRDDTSRVLGRNADVTIAASPVWDPNSPALTENSAGSAVVDDLPPFASLTTDEDREKKAETSSPGTYNVVVGPESFQHLPEYNDEPEIKRELLPTLRRGSIATSLASSLGREAGVEAIPLSGDPNTVVLPRFQDVKRRSTFSSNRAHSPISPIVRSAIIKSEAIIKIEDQEEAVLSEESDSLSETAGVGQETRYLRQFRQVVWKHLVPAELDQRDGMVRSSVHILEHAANSFPPLHHAMMAVAALSVAVQDGKEWLDALQYYQQALPALQSTLRGPDDLSSDGAFLTHFLLLVYEIAAAEAEHSNLWSQHLLTLLQISLLRRDESGREVFPFVVWWICHIDLDALLSGAGSGGYVESLLNNDFIPPPSFHLYPLGHDGSSVLYAEEVEVLPTILQLDYEVSILAIRMALLAREFRSDITFDDTDVLQRDQAVRIRQSRIFEIQEALRQLWITPAVVMIHQEVETLPTRPKQLYEHAATLYRACIIYSHTSMWPGQRLETSPDYDTEIAVASSQILQMASKALAEDRSYCRYLVFPVFMAGFVATDGAHRMHAVDLLREMEKSSIGRNTMTTRKALAAVYEKQNERFMNTGQSLDVDWMHVMVQEGLLVVNFGL
ncbi:uncharacterized protein Z519_00518 [Cladophialophora bantiana CBS 173.52]|uniref:Zn(2)-C6 fungal-type domain-containing protein n=1 Tax=Cladophialophora bantiana (strain ATCC 10958 / CBS 173.52 / CDC B-1940 / NIH 8579) TaxID=1442370 RepID=A0A0D2I6F0_CLAB1|nr:uncharacterized protein Z519_00518 [Cladophialophora bantiana CBS 173.52]KIW98855.1 hypothetical protein Z519_00518 [Cladophialophora bantiana CBS 173.52]